jgi:small GTP-binding protein
MNYQIDEETVVIKVIVLGAANVGKTALMERYCCDKFSDVRSPSIGSDFRSKIIEFDQQRVALQVWDTAVSFTSIVNQFLFCCMFFITSEY